LEETVDRYLEQIHELESAKNSATTTAKMVEKVSQSSVCSFLTTSPGAVQYKDKSVVLERERFEALTALDMKEQELIHLKRDLEDAIEGKRFLEEEVTGLRSVSCDVCLAKHSSSFLETTNGSPCERQ
jgi:hypothetical protein